MSNIAVILINYNGIHDTLECVESIKKSSIKSDIVIVDNSEDTDDYRKLQEYSDLIVLRPGTNLGFSGGNNYALSYALDHEYEYIVLLNNDTIIEERMMEQLVENCDEKTVSLPVMYYFYFPQKVWYAGGHINRYLGLAKHDERVKNDHFYDCSYATGCCIAAQANVYRMIGPLDESFFMYCEDFDYSIRLLKNKFRIRIVPNAKLYHKVGASSKNISESTIYYNVRNRILLLQKNKDFFFPTAIIYTVITRLIHMMYYRLKDKDRYLVYKKAYEDGMAGISGRKDLRKDK